MEHFFKDLKVIELAGVLAGPSVGQFFAELGASVIKIENPLTHGDVTRGWKLKGENPKEDTSSYFWSVNAFKTFKSLNLSKTKDLEQLYDLVKEADIVIANHKVGADKLLKVDYATLSKIRPNLIYAGIHGFGSDSVRSAYDLILQAESGFMSINGEANSQPLKMPVALIDIIAAHQAKEAVLIALIKRYKENKGSHVSISLFDSAIASLANQATNWLIGKALPKQSGSLHPNIAPYGEVFETKDKQQITFAIGSNKQFRDLCDLIQYSHLASDSKYASNQQRIVNRTQLYALLFDYIKHFSLKELYDACLERGIPMGKIRNIKEVFELPEAKAMLRNFEYQSKQLSVVSGIAFKFHT